MIVGNVLSLQQAAGVGRLLFESVKGVQKQLHSAVDKVLPALLPKLYSSKLPILAVSESLVEMWDSMASYVAPHNALPVWNALLVRYNYYFMIIL